MEKRRLATLLAITAAVAGAVKLTAPDGGADAGSQAAAAALDAEMAWLFTDPEGRIHVSDSTLPRVWLCVASDVPVNFAVLSETMKGSRLRPLPVANCTSKTVEGDFGMFSAMTTWFAENGDEAAHLEIKAVHCPTARHCMVDIDAVGAGMRYELRKSGTQWAPIRTDLRWAV